MKKKSLYALLLAITVNLLIMSGCWNYKEINDKAIVVGAAIDYDKESDGVILTAEIVTPIHAKNQTVIESQVVSAKGVNLYDAARNLVAVTGKGLFWSHAKVMIIGKEAAEKKDKLIGTIDVLKRDAEIRDDIYLLISKQKLARDIYRNKDLEIEKLLSFHLENMIKNEKNISKYHAVPLWEFIDTLASEGTSAVLPTIMVDESKKKPYIYGTQIFRGESLVGWLDGLETKYYLTVIDKLKGGIIAVKENKEDKEIMISLEVMENKTKAKPKYTGDKLTMNIDIETEVIISEIQGTVDFIKEDRRIGLEESAERKIKNETLKLIKKLQNKYKSDIFGFGDTVHREMPEVWKEIKEDWEEHFADLEIDVNVVVNIKGSALRSKPIQVEE